MSDLIITLFVASPIAVALLLLCFLDEKRRRSLAFNDMLSNEVLHAGSAERENDLSEAPDDEIVDGLLSSDYTGMTDDEINDEFAKAAMECLRDETKVRYADEYSEEKLAELRTRKLIGNEKYDKMAKNVDRLLDLHKADASLSVRLTSGPDTPEGCNELHSLLPGDPLWLRKNVDGGMDVVDVYSGGFRIGRLLLQDAAKVVRLMGSSQITGTYVSEQNSYGDCAEVSLGIILFHSGSDEYNARRKAELSRPWVITVDGPKRIVLYQN